MANQATIKLSIFIPSVCHVSLSRRHIKKELRYDTKMIKNPITYYKNFFRSMSYNNWTLEHLSNARWIGSFTTFTPSYGTIFSEKSPDHLTSQDALFKMPFINRFCHVISSFYKVDIATLLPQHCIRDPKILNSCDSTTNWLRH